MDRKLGNRMPQLDVARVQRWRAAPVPLRLHDEIRGVCDLDAPHISPFATADRPGREDFGPETTRFPTARLHNT